MRRIAPVVVRCRTQGGPAVTMNPTLSGESIATLGRHAYTTCIPDTVFDFRLLPPRSA
ncbi:MAG: hypothetical protein ACFCUN_03075 [Hyphomicrobiaceae bacterium]